MTKLHQQYSMNQQWSLRITLFFNISMELLRLFLKFIKNYRDDIDFKTLKNVLNVVTLFNQDTKRYPSELHRKKAG